MPKTPPLVRHSKARFEQVLEYMDGPQAVLLAHGKDRKIVAVAIERDGHIYPFFGAAISLNQWDRYRRGVVDLRFLFMLPKWRRWYFFDLADMKDGFVPVVSADRDAFAASHYIPDSGFFSYHHSEPIKLAHLEGLAIQRYETDGVWDLPDFTSFYNKITDIYVFHLSLKTYCSPSTPDAQKRRIRDAFVEHPLRGGSSYVNLYNDLANVQQLDERLSVGRLQYASAGHVDIRGRYDIFAAMSEPLEEFDANYDVLKAKYSKLHSYLQKNGYLKAKAEALEEDSGAAKFVRTEADDLARQLHLEDAELIYELAGRHTLQYAKILLAYFRRLEGYYLFFAEGRAKETEMIPGDG